MYIKLLVGTSHLLFLGKLIVLFVLFFFVVILFVVVLFFLRRGGGLTFIFKVLGKLID